MSAVAYPAEGRLLFVEFRQIGEVYLYFDVSREEFLQLLRADSKGGSLIGRSAIAFIICGRAVSASAGERNGVFFRSTYSREE